MEFVFNTYIERLRLLSHTIPAASLVMGTSFTEVYHDKSLAFSGAMSMQEIKGLAELRPIMSMQIMTNNLSVIHGVGKNNAMEYL